VVGGWWLVSIFHNECSVTNHQPPTTMRKEPLSVRRFLGRAVAWALLPALAVGIFFAYRWGERQRASPTIRPVTGASGVTVRLENAPFQGYTNGRLAWALRAEQIDVQRVPGGSLANVANATLTGIRDGALYEIPAEVKPVLTASSATGTSPPPRSETTSSKETPLFATTRPKTPPAATFHARQGFYTLGETEPLPPQLSTIYTVQWRFKLVGNVDFQTRTGERLRADTLTILELMHRRTWRVERRILCETGVRVTSKKVEALSNHAEYFPKSRTVECSGGVRGTSGDVTIQAERLFWFLGEETIRCPETVQGTRRGIPFTAEGLVVDLKRNRFRASRARLEIRTEEAGDFGLP
jgi:hypothetical protein